MKPMKIPEVPGWHLEKVSAELLGESLTLRRRNRRAGIGPKWIRLGQRILYKDGGEWKPVSALSPYGVAKDAPNRVQFAKVTTSALSMEATLQPTWSGGVLEWTVQ